LGTTFSDPKRENFDILCNEEKARAAKGLTEPKDLDGIISHRE
jgi:hypothetical protein